MERRRHPRFCRCSLNGCGPVGPTPAPCPLLQLLGSFKEDGVQLDDAKGPLGYFDESDPELSIMRAKLER